MSTLAPLRGGLYTFLAFNTAVALPHDDSAKLVTRVRVQMTAEAAFRCGAMLVSQMLSVSEMQPSDLDVAIESLEEHLKMLKKKKRGSVKKEG